MPPYNPLRFLYNKNDRRIEIFRLFKMEFLHRSELDDFEMIACNFLLLKFFKIIIFENFQSHTNNPSVSVELKFGFNDLGKIITCQITSLDYYNVEIKVKNMNWFLKRSFFYALCFI